MTGPLNTTLEGYVPGERVALVISDVSHSYREGSGPRLVLDDINFAVPAGQVVSLLGPSGCGKSTLLRVILGLIRPTQGKIYVFGRSAENGYPDARLAAMLQRPALLPWRTAVRNVELPLELRRYSRAKRRELSIAALRAVGMDDDYLRYPPPALSAGMQQRVALARALVTKPKILLLDEPFSSLDRITREQLQLETLRLLQANGCASLVVTHDLDEAAYLSNTVMLLSSRPARIVAREVMPGNERTDSYRESSEFTKSVVRLRRLLRRTVD
jgi:NitT/TauT family transport system ATP-binding protein